MERNHKSTPSKKEIKIRQLHDNTNVMIVGNCAIKISRYERNLYPDGSVEFTIHIKEESHCGETIVVTAELINSEEDEVAYASNQITEQSLREFKKSARIQRRSSAISIICVILQIVIAVILLIWSYYY